MELDEEADRPRAVKVLALMAHLDPAVGQSAVSVVLHLIPHHPVRKRHIVDEALALVEEGDDVLAVDGLLLLGDVEADLHHIPHGHRVLRLGVPLDAGEHKVEAPGPTPRICRKSSVL